MERQVTTYRLGTGGWEHEVFDQCLYPTPNMNTTDKLRYYGHFFDTVEVRQTFWDDSLSAGDARQWADAVTENKRFIFHLKMHSSFTHRMEIRLHAATIVRGLLQELAKRDRLGSLIAQFPFSFTNTSVHRYHLTRLSEVFRGFPIHVELRHGSWHQPSLLSFLGEHALQPISADFPRIKQYMPFITGDVGAQAYIRLHGRNEKGWLLNGQDTRYDYSYNGKELRELERRVIAFSTRHKQITIIFNNTTAGKAVANVFQLAAALRESKTVLIPSAALRAFPILHNVSGSSGEGDSLLGMDDIRKVV